MIDEFQNEIYPVSLFVYKLKEEENEVEVLSNRFKAFRTDCKTECTFEPIEDYNGAYTCFVIDKETSRRGPLIVVREDIHNYDICHECIHAVDIYYKLLGIIAQDYEDTNEPYAYLAGYIFKSVELVLRGENI